MSNKKLVVFEGRDEVIICAREDRDRLVSKYFQDPDDRDLADYDETYADDVRITPEIHVRIF